MSQLIYAEFIVLNSFAFKDNLAAAFLSLFAYFELL